MFNPFKQSRQTQPFLSPLGRQRGLPAAAAPLAVTLVGGVALVVVFGALISGMTGGAPSQPAAVEQEAAAQPAEPPPAVPDTPAAEPARPVDTTRAALTAPSSEIAPSAEAAPPAGAAPPAEADPASTAAIDLEPILPPVTDEVPVAESEADIAVLEAIHHDADESGPDQQARDGDGEAVARAEPPAPALRGARVRQAVNLRAAPDNDGRVLTVVPSGAEVEAEADCGWCAVRYRGSSGFLYKSFLDYR